MEGTPWYLFVKADIHDRRIWAKAPTNRLEKCIKDICYNNIKLTVVPHIYGSHVGAVKTHDTSLVASSDSKICWLAGFLGGLMPWFSSSTPVSTQSRFKKTDVTQFIVAYYTHGELEGIMRNDFGLEETRTWRKEGKKQQKSAKTAFRSNMPRIETKYGQRYSSYAYLDLPRTSGQGLGEKRSYFKEQGASSYWSKEDRNADFRDFGHVFVSYGDISSLRWQRDFKEG